LWTACAEGAAGAATEDAEPAGSPAGEPTAAERTYLASWQLPRQVLEVTLGRYVDLMAAPTPGDAAWLNTMAIELLGWATIHGDLADMDPPARYADLHATCAEAIALLDAAAHEQIPNLDDWIAGQVDTVDMSAFDLALLQTRYAEAEPLLAACFDGLDAATAEAGG
jgi:hypothetical protein